MCAYQKLTSNFFVSESAALHHIIEEDKKNYRSTEQDSWRVHQTKSYIVGISNKQKRKRKRKNLVIFIWKFSLNLQQRSQKLVVVVVVERRSLTTRSSGVLQAGNTWWIRKYIRVAPRDSACMASLYFTSGQQDGADWQLAVILLAVQPYTLQPIGGQHESTSYDDPGEKTWCFYNY